MRPLARAAGEYHPLDLKTAIIGKIAEFVRWPPEAGLDDPTRPFELVILGDTPLGPRLFAYYGTQGVTIAGHRVFLRRARNVDDIGHAHLLFVGPNYENRLHEVLAAIGQMSVLTMGDTEGYAQPRAGGEPVPVERPGPVRDLPAGAGAATAVGQLPAAGTGAADRGPTGEAVMRGSISRKLLAVTVGVISVAVALAGGFLLRQHHRELYRGFESGKVELARAVADHSVALAGVRGQRRAPARSWPSSSAARWRGRCCTTATATWWRPTAADG